MSNVVELLYLCRQVSVLVFFCFEEKFFRVCVQAEKLGPNQHSNRAKMSTLWLCP